MRRSLGVALVGAVIMVSCSEASDPGDDAARIDPAGAEAECSGVVVEDEYGYPIEIDTCTEEIPVDARRDPAVLLDEVPSESARVALSALFRAADALNAACDDLDAWTADGRTTAAGAIQVARQIEDDPLLEDWLNRGAARELSALLRNRLVVQAACDAPPESEVGPARLKAALFVAGRLTWANDLIRIALTGATGGAMIRASEFWSDPDQIAHTIEALRLLDEGDIDVLMVGPSTGKNAFDPSTLTTSLGSVYFNASLPGMLPDSVGFWLDMLFELGVAPERVVLSIDAWADGLPCESGMYLRATTTTAFAERAFEHVPGVADQSPLMRLIGGADTGYSGRLMTIAQRRWEPESNGRLDAETEHDPERAQTQRETYVERFADAVPCAEMVATVAETVASLDAQGIEAVLVALPISDAMAELVPGGRTTLAMRIEEYRDAVEPFDSQVVDLSELVGDDQFVDITHVTASGRDAVTEALLAEL